MSEKKSKSKSKYKYPISGYAPGNYINKCASCKKDFIGDKLSRQCEPCAIETVESNIPEKKSDFCIKECDVQVLAMKFDGKPMVYCMGCGRKMGK
jgi:hypothetical protein